MKHWSRFSNNNHPPVRQLALRTARGEGRHAPAKRILTANQGTANSEQRMAARRLLGAFRRLRTKRLPSRAHEVRKWVADPVFAAALDENLLQMLADAPVNLGWNRADAIDEIVQNLAWIDQLLQFLRRFTWFPMIAEANGTEPDRTKLPMEPVLARLRAQSARLACLRDILAMSPADDPARFIRLFLASAGQDEQMHELDKRRRDHERARIIRTHARQMAQFGRAYGMEAPDLADLLPALEQMRSIALDLTDSVPGIQTGTESKPGMIQAKSLGMWLIPLYRPVSLPGGTDDRIIVIHAGDSPVQADYNQLFARMCERALDRYNQSLRPRGGRPLAGAVLLYRLFGFAGRDDAKEDMPDRDRLRELARQGAWSEIEELTRPRLPAREESTEETGEAAHAGMLRLLQGDSATEDSVLTDTEATGREVCAHVRLRLNTKQDTPPGLLLDLVCGAVRVSLAGGEMAYGATSIMLTLTLHNAILMPDLQSPTVMPGEPELLATHLVPPWLIQPQGPYRYRICCDSPSLLVGSSFGIALGRLHLHPGWRITASLGMRARDLCILSEAGLPYAAGTHPGQNAARRILYWKLLGERTQPAFAQFVLEERQIIDERG